MQRALKEGFHVVTPNKKANTRELAITMNYVAMHKRANINSYTKLT